LFCIFLPWKFGPPFSSRVGRSLIYLVSHWSLIFGPVFSVDPSCVPIVNICDWDISVHLIVLVTCWFLGPGLN